MTKKIGRNLSRWSVLGISLASILLSLLLIYSPVVGAFGGSTANCAGGDSVSCSGYKCTATDNVGCSCTNADGSKGESHPCKKGGDDEFMIEEFAY